MSSTKKIWNRNMLNLIFWTVQELIESWKILFSLVAWSIQWWNLQRSRLHKQEHSILPAFSRKIPGSKIQAEAFPHALEKSSFFLQSECSQITRETLLSKNNNSRFLTVWKVQIWLESPWFIICAGPDFPGQTMIKTGPFILSLLGGKWPAISRRIILLILIACPRKTSSTSVLEFSLLLSDQNKILQVL